MSTIRTLTLFALVLIIGFFTVTSNRQCMALEPDYASGVNSRNGDASPDPGYSYGETNSRVDDYINQDEQINLDVNSGLVKVLRANQKTSVNDYVEAIVRCHNVNPRELRGPIRTLVRKEGGDADVIQDKVKNEFFLHVTCPKFQLPYVEAVIQALDEEWVREREDGSAELYYQAKFRDVNDILNITQFYRGPEGFFQIDSLNNALYYNDQPATMGLQKFGLKNADIPPNQISLDVAIYEVSATNEYKLGLDYVAWKNGPGRNLFVGVSQYAHLHGKYYVDWRCFGGDNTVKLHDLISEPRSRFRYGSFNFLATAAYVDFLVSRGKAKLLTKTNVMVKSGNTAEVSSVQDIVGFRPGHIPASKSNTAPDTEKSPAPPDNPDGSTSKLIHNNCQATVEVPETIPIPVEYGYDRILDYVKAGNIGVRVTFTPYIGLETAEADIDIAVSDVNGYSPQGTPIINTQYLYSYARLKADVPYVLGGITRKETVKSSGKIPFLGDLPVLGWLAGGEQDVARETEIVIVVTPKFILGTESVMEMPEEAQTVMAQVTGEESLRIPANPFGFDQWLLDSEK